MEYEVESDRVIAFRPEIARLLESNDAALMFQQLLHWSKYTKNPGGWIYKSATEMFEETNVTERKQRKARDILVGIEWIEAEKKMANGSPTWHYRVLVQLNSKVLASDLTSSTGKLPGATGKNAGSITKNTHKNNTLVEKHAEDIKKLYKGWLIEMIVSPHDWISASAEDRSALLAAAERSVRLTPKRKEKLAARLDTYDFPVCARAIRKLAKSDWHRGDNENKWKASLEWLFHSDERLESWANR